MHIFAQYTKNKMENFKPKTEEELRIEKVRKGMEKDEDGYCGCPECGSRRLIHDGGSLDNSYIKCLDCRFCSDSYDDPYDVIAEWNSLDRSGTKKI